MQREGKLATAETVLMVKPVDFCFNEEAAGDNEFMKRLQIPKDELTSQVLKEFDTLVGKLRDAGVEVLVVDKTQNDELKDVFTPDAVFPNNWISTEPEGLVYTFPMFAPSRREEKKALPVVEKLFIQGGFELKGITQIGSDLSTEPDRFLEGTGSMIIDRANKIAYACRSMRTCDRIFNTFCELSGYKGVIFDAKSSTGTAFYHTNMIMSIGEKFIAICLDSIVDEKQKATVCENLKASGKEIIELTLEQVEKHCCGNILEVRSRTTKENLIVMSESAFKGFTTEQKAKLEKHGKIIHSNIDLLEQIGGGSVRCMLCEVFLPKKN